MNTTTHNIMIKILKRFVIGLLFSLHVTPALAATIWPSSATPANASVDDPTGVELGVKFKSDSAGVITGIRFYKGTANTGTHTGNLWTASGTLLATAPFTNETASGWQQVNFATPVAITTNTVYVASYHAPNGNYAANNNFFASQGVANPPLHAFGTADVSGGNGVYAYGPQSRFPNSSYQATNYWVDVVFDASATPPPVSGSGPILVITSATNSFTQYYGEILRAEGLNEFATADIGNVTSATLANHDIVILGEIPLSDAQVTMLTDWVNGGGNLIAMRPDKKLAGLLGLADASAARSDAYLLVSQAGPGRGIVNQTIQYHSAADLYTLSGAAGIATLYSDPVTATANPAVTLRTAGNGRAAAFVYDLARSVVYTRQGNPAWAGQERDNAPPQAIRPDDLFFPDFVNLNKVAIPQADEQQRLLANLITHMNLAKKPLPRFWYLPSGHKAAIVHTLDDHNVNATRPSFGKFNDRSAPGCSVDDWQCLRMTSWFYTGASLTDAEAASFLAQGFEMGVHVQNNNCTNFTSFADLDVTYVRQLGDFQTAYPSLPPQTTHRYHCIVWSDWVTQARVMASHGIRYSMDYYYWPDAWVQQRPGLFTGSGFPMRFADVDGTIIDVYQGVSQLVNENGLVYPSAINVLLDQALGPDGYYGLFGTHDDWGNGSFSAGVIDAAQSRNVPVISAKQALTWIDGRNASSFGAISWNGRTLGFTVTPGAGARNLRGMVPLNSATNSVTAIVRNGAPVAFTTEIVKGIHYAFFPVTAGSYVATYDGPIVEPPSPPAGGLTIWPSTATPAAASVDDPNPVELGVKFRSDRNGQIAGIRFYKGPGNTGTHVANLWTSTGTKLATATFVGETASGWQQVNFTAPVAMTANTVYVASYHTSSGNYAANNDYFLTTGVDNGPLHALSDPVGGGNGVYVYGASAFPTSSFRSTNYWVDVVFIDTPPKTLWSTSTIPTTPSVNDPNAVELGVKWSADVPGKVKGIRFYKGQTNTGAHTATLWTAGGSALAAASFTNETATGWQEVLFATPVDIAANATYVASYHAPNGNYAADVNYFANAFDNAPLHAPASGLSGGNGVYKYGASAFPTETFNANNYWVDVVFEPTP